MLLLQLYITMLLRLIALAEGAFRLLKLNSGLHFKNSKSQGFKQGVG
jgi:hypothetical protein